jgi:hypothetical protein
MARLLLRVALTASIACVPLAVRADVPKNAFTVVNNGGVPLHFSYGCQPDGEMTRFELAKDDTRDFWNDSGCTKYNITMSTGPANGTAMATVTYTALAGHRYSLLWDTKKKEWNIFLDEDPADTGFRLTNVDTVPLHFAYGCAGDTVLTGAVLAAKASRKYRYAQGCPHYTIKKSTTGSGGKETTFTYTLNGGHAYTIGWNARKHAWDVFDPSLAKH